MSCYALELPDPFVFGLGLKPVHHVVVCEDLISLLVIKCAQSLVPLFIVGEIFVLIVDCLDNACPVHLSIRLWDKEGSPNDVLCVESEHGQGL